MMESNCVWIYCRIAPSDDFTVDAQLAELRRYAAHNGYLTVGATAECGSGLALDRPGISEVTEAVRRGRMDTLIVKDLSRIGRGCELIQDYIDFLCRHGVALVTLSERLQIRDCSELFAPWQQKSRVVLQHFQML
ncbi:MAG: recombinase family protein [Ethanoligenens sp.]